MDTLYLDLKLTKPKKNDPPASPVAQIRVKEYSLENDQIILGSKCVTFSEIDKQIQWIEQELESIRKQAKAKLEI